jgi:hypothetical protein
MIIKKYKELRDSEGGIFTSKTRRRLLAVKPDKKLNFREDNYDMWRDIKIYVKNGLKDLELFCETAHPDQVREVFKTTVDRNIEDLERKPSLEKTLSILLKDFKTYKKKINPENDLKYSEPSNIDRDRVWKAELAYNIIRIALKYFQDENLITSKIHERLCSEVLDMLQSEIRHIEKSSS